MNQRKAYPQEPFQLEQNKVIKILTYEKNATFLESKFLVKRGVNFNVSNMSIGLVYGYKSKPTIH